MAQLPTTEDLREYSFPSLVASTNTQRAAAADFIDSLNLVEDGEERVDPKQTYNPAIQYFGQVVCDKIKNQGDNKKIKELPAVNPAIEEYVRPDREMFERAEAEISAFDSVFDLQK